MPPEVQQLIEQTIEDPAFWVLSIAFDILFYGSIFNAVAKKRREAHGNAA